jgi:hypothetical protein
VKVWAKNPEGKNIKMSPVRNGNGEELRREKEEHPAANRQEEEFMGMGGKGDMLLFADDVSSRYLPEEVPKEK